MKLFDRENVYKLVKRVVGFQRRISMSEEYFQFLEQTQRNFHQIESIFQDHEFPSSIPWKDVEEKLVVAGIGLPTSRSVVNKLQQQVEEKRISSGSQAYAVLQQELTSFLKKPAKLHFPKQSSLTVMLVMSDTDSGETAIAKLAYYLSQRGHNVLVVVTEAPRSGDINPVNVLPKQASISVMYENDDLKLHSFVHDALQSALLHTFDVVLIGTAASMPVQKTHLEKLNTIIHATQQVIPNAPQELLLVLNASQGPNALPYAHAIAQTTGLTGIILSNIENTSAGGIIFDIADDLRTPIIFLDIGEKIEQLIPFDPEKFVTALFAVQPH